MFLWTRKLKKKKRTEENYITAFNSLKSRFICQRKRTILKIDFQKFNLRHLFFAVYRT